MNPKQYVRTNSTSYYNTSYQYTFIHNKDEGGSKMHGMRRVITFCLLTTVVPSILIILPLYLRNVKYADVMYKISYLDTIQIHKGQSTIFCEKHSLSMNSTFNARQMKGLPKLSNVTKHIQFKQSMVLPDDTLEYWGFKLFKGSTVKIRACSLLKGASVMVVKGEKKLNTCGILEKNKNKKYSVISDHVHVVTWETPGEAEESDQLLPKDMAQIVLDTKYNDQVLNRNARSIPLHNPNTILDTGVTHGGNAFNNTIPDTDVSSYEQELCDCFRNNIILKNFTVYSDNCNGTESVYLESIKGRNHSVDMDGFYYYIFFSDNEALNDVHVILDIYKPTFQYDNLSDDKVCINQTVCDFNIEFLSNELVIVEVPTKEGNNIIEAEDFILMSVCHPRVSVYIIFPIAVLLLILLFAFL